MWLVNHHHANEEMVVVLQFILILCLLVSWSWSLVLFTKRNPGPEFMKRFHTQLITKRILPINVKMPKIGGMQDRYNMSVSKQDESIFFSI